MITIDYGLPFQALGPVDCSVARVEMGLKVLRHSIGTISKIQKLDAVPFSPT